MANKSSRKQSIIGIVIDRVCLLQVKEATKENVISAVKHGRTDGKQSSRVTERKVRELRFQKTTTNAVLRVIE